MATIDIIILAKNEARNLPDCLASFKGLGQAVVIDDNSSDGTARLAREAGALVFERAMDSFSGQRNYALTVSNAEWVFFLDADERFSPGLVEAVRERVGGPKVAGKARRRNFAFGRRFRFGHLAPDWVTRLFPRGEVTWSGEVHESPETGLEAVALPGFLEHHTYRGWDQFLSKMERYARLWAKGAAIKGKRSSVIGALAKASFTILKNLVLKLGFLDGPYGWAVCVVSGYYTLSKYLFLNSLDCEGRELSGEGRDLATEDSDSVISGPGKR
ncbi:MAG: glycosyltransferase family 2 protein [Deltaproteobacteria bacterium]|jgi:glycosyltransferase involved in cell wall biosynthesis|nr:glycosyltransferase family 2 protein [Deltaproteobacteria bacterium]